MSSRKLWQQMFGLTMAVSLLTGCGAAPEPTATPTPVPPTSTPTPMPPTSTPTPEPPTPTPTPEAPTLTPTPTLPTYSEILGTYPEGVELSCTDAQVSEVTSDGGWVFTGGLVCPGGARLTVAEGGTFTVPGAWDNWRGYGAKITVAGPITIDGVTYEPGTLLTVDKDLEWIEVLSWD